MNSKEKSDKKFDEFIERYAQPEQKLEWEYFKKQMSLIDKILNILRLRTKEN